MDGATPGSLVFSWPESLADILASAMGKPPSLDTEVAWSDADLVAQWQGGRRLGGVPEGREESAERLDQCVAAAASTAHTVVYIHDMYEVVTRQAGNAEEVQEEDVRHPSARIAEAAGGNVLPRRNRTSWCFALRLARPLELMRLCLACCSSAAFRLFLLNHLPPFSLSLSVFLSVSFWVTMHTSSFLPRLLCACQFVHPSVSVAAFLPAYPPAQMLAYLPA
jgi:hypothetical protein